MPVDFEKTCKKCSVVYESALSNFSKAKAGKDGLQSKCKLCMHLWYLDNKDRITKDRVNKYTETRKEYARQYQQNNRQKLKEYSLNYRQSNEERLKEKGQEYRQANSEKIAERKLKYARDNKVYINEKARQHYALNKDQNSARKRQYNSQNYNLRKDKINERRRAYYQRNKDAVKEYVRKYLFNHKDVYRLASSKRRCQKLKSTPVWVDYFKVKLIYQNAVNKEKITGFRHEVDHIDPLQHPLICGLHIPANLQILTTTENRAKNNKFIPYRVTQDGSIILFTEAELQA